MPLRWPCASTNPGKIYCPDKSRVLGLPQKDLSERSSLPT
jgi:hypothetical protein